MSADSFRRPLQLDRSLLKRTKVCTGDCEELSSREYQHHDHGLQLPPAAKKTVGRNHARGRLPRIEELEIFSFFLDISNIVQRNHTFNVYLLTSILSVNIMLSTYLAAQMDEHD